jgi:predicted RNA binding protein YcfA (HicA-like mRNA interferase family)
MGEVCKRASLKYGDLIKKVEKDGWHLVRMVGSHGQYKHPEKPGRVTIAGKPGEGVSEGTRKSILRQACLE